MQNLDIVTWAESPIGFYTDRAWQNGRWELGSRPIQLACYHADLLRHVLTTDASGRLPYDVIGWCEPAKSGKSAIAGLLAQYFGLHGEPNSMVVMASNKQNQAASVMYSSFAESLRMNPALDLDPGALSTAMPNGCVVKAIPSNSRGEAGARFSLALFDELWGYVHQDAERLWSEFKVDPTRTNSVKVSIGYAGYLESELWLEQLQIGKRGQPVPGLAHIVNSDGEPACWANGRHFTFWSDTCRQPWQTEAWIESQRRSLRPAEFQRMIRCVFVQGVGNFVDPDAWARCIDPEHNVLQPGGGQRLYIGLDLAFAANGDDAAAIAVYKDELDDKIKVAWHRLWRGKDRAEPLKFGASVQPFLLRMAELYNVAGIYFDVWQAKHLVDEMRDAGLPCVEVPQTWASRGPKDTALYDLISDGRLVLYDHFDLRNAAAGANAKELGNGMIYLQKAGGRSKIDLLVALSNAANEPDTAASWWIW
jgi:phage terminase large subunit-like protein